MLRKLQLILTLIWWSFSYYDGVVGDPQNGTLLKRWCSVITVSNSNERSFYGNINDTFIQLRRQIWNENKHFCTAEKGSDNVPVYSMFKCRDYLSIDDCLACFTTATTQIRDCSGFNGARVMYDGCFLRYESGTFYGDTYDDSGNGLACNDTSTNGETTFEDTVQQALREVQLETPRFKGISIATKTPIASGGAVYAAAECVETTTNDVCLRCMEVVHNNLITCLPNTGGSAYIGACYMRYSDRPFFDENQTVDLGHYSKQGRVENQTVDLGHYSKQGNSSSRWAIIGCVVGGAVVFILAIILALQQCKKPKRIPRANILGATCVKKKNMLGATELRGPLIYKYTDLKDATKNFSDTNKLGEGGFGDVYKGTLKNGKVVAVKKLILGKSSKMENDFESEVKLIRNVHHRNLVRLLGCCSKGQERILVYEYMANNSLDKFLFGAKKGSLNWNQRYDIIFGTARGLAYLHEEFHISIIHRDIKSSNILLDDNLQPKIADFGLARLLPGDRSHLTTGCAGTMGYIAPEYAINGQLSQKADTYSYGIVVLEIISGQKNTEVKLDDSGEYLLRRACKLHDRDMQLELVDKSLDPNDYDREEVKKVIDIALLCTQVSPGMRPTMSEAVVLLQRRSLIEHLQPTTPVFIETNVKSREGHYTASPSSNATASISILSAR